MKHIGNLLSVVGFFLSLSTASAAPPKAADNRLLVELVAQEPDIVTPTGVAVDEQGRIWVIENHTHQRPAKYKGPTTDRIRILEDFGPDGKARKFTTWADGFQNTMSITLTKNGVLVATRSAIYLVRDTKGTGKADDKKVLVTLDSKTTYPHNGLSGFAIDALGEIHFGLGENFGAPYKLIGADKTTLTGSGEGGNIFRMKPDGSGLTKIATGFWNPFHMAFDRWGRLFAVDNDPDSRGPCRLLHIVQDGDYGYRFKYGRKGIHPFQSWNGELPGTLPMVAGTAEAPSGIVAYESDGLPEEYRGLLLVTSWGDHVIEQFQLEPRGASFGAKKKIMVRGDSNFRPVGIVIAPDGSLIVSDWVDQSYPVHGKGRIWRLRMKEPPKGDGMTSAKLKTLDVGQLYKVLNHPKRELRSQAADAIVASAASNLKPLKDALREERDPLARLHLLWATQQLKDKRMASYLTSARMILDDSEEVRAQAIVLFGRMDGQIQFGDPIFNTVATDDVSARVRMHAFMELKTHFYVAGLVPMLADSDPFVVHAAVMAVSHIGRLSGDKLKWDDPMFAKDAKARVGVLLALRRARSRELWASICLEDSDPAVRRAAIQWIGEEQLTSLAEKMDQSVAKPPLTREVFEAWLAAKELLANPGNLKDANKELGGDAFVLKIVNDAKQPAAFRAMALRMLPPNHGKLTIPGLVAFTKDNDKSLQAEAVKTLAWRNNPPAQKALRELALDPKLPADLRRDAVMGLAYSASSDAETRKALLHLAKEPTFAVDVLRSLRASVTPDEVSVLWQTRKDLGEEILFSLRKSPGIVKISAANWQEILSTAKGEPLAGERVFFHSKGPRCYSCHRIDGRGEAVGPDLSRIGAALDRKKLIESILEPSKEIAPAFTTWLVTMTDGKQHTGVIALESFDSTMALVDAQGKRTVLKITDIEDRVAQKTSIMPADLHALMTRQEFADLLAFLESRK